MLCNLELSFYVRLDGIRASFGYCFDPSLLMIVLETHVWILGLGILFRFGPALSIC